MKKLTSNKFVIKYGAMVVACILYAFSVAVFTAPNKIVAGGMTGIGTMLNALFGWNIGVMTTVLNIPILLFALKKQGWRFVLDSFITIAVLSLFTDLFSMYIPVITNDSLLACVYAGLMQGIAVGLFLRYKVSSGGSELLGRLISEATGKLSMQLLVGIIDTIIVVTGTFVLQNPENLLYVLILIFISTKVSDIVIVGFSRAKMCYIITNYPYEVGELLLKHLKRGVTRIEGTGMYTGATHYVLMTVIRRNQISQIKNILKFVDSHAFLIVSDSSEVYGQGFSSIVQSDDQQPKPRRKALKKPEKPETPSADGNTP